MSVLRRVPLWLTLVASLLVLFAVGLHAASAEAASTEMSGPVASAPQPANPDVPVPSVPTTEQGWEESFKALISTRALSVGGRVVIAIVLFIIGWVVAKSASYGVFTLLSKTKVDNVLAQKLGITLLMPDRDGDGERGEEGGAVERLVAKIVFWMFMLLVIVGVLQFAGLSQVAGPIERLVDTVIQALPRVGKAGLILLVAYIAGLILKMVVTSGLDSFGVDRRFAQLAETEDDVRQPFSTTAGNIVFWLLIVFGLAGAFEALEITPISEPLHGAIDRVVGILPKLAIAALLVFVGWTAGRILRVVVRNLLTSLGFDRLVARIGLEKFTGKSSPSDLVGVTLMVFVMLQATIAGLNELGLETLSGPLTGMVAQIWNALPAIAVSILILGVGVFVGGLLRQLVSTALRNLGFDRLMERIGFGKIADRDDRLGEFSELVAYGVQIGVVLLAVAQALDNLGLDTWSAYVNGFLAYLLKNVAVALAVVLVGFVIGKHVRDLIVSRQGDNETGKWIGEFARYAVLVFAFTMAVRQLDVAEDFVLMTFGLLFGALCLAIALSFGLGGREVAGDIVKRRYEQARGKLASRPPVPPKAPPAPPGSGRPPITVPGSGNSPFGEGG
jgi:hypothetical protein